MLLDDHETLRRGPLAFNTRTRWLSIGESQIHLSKTRARLLACLMRAERPVTGAHLIWAAWGLAPDQANYLKNNLYVQLHLLRRQINVTPLGPILVAESEPGGRKRARVYRLRVNANGNGSQTE